MRHLAAYLLLVSGGNAAPTAEDVKTLLGTVGVEVDQDRLDGLISDLEGKNLAELIELGKEQLCAGGAPGGGGGGAAPAAAGAPGTRSLSDLILEFERNGQSLACNLKLIQLLPQLKKLPKNQKKKKLTLLTAVWTCLEVEVEAEEIISYPFLLLSIYFKIKSIPSEKFGSF